MGRQIGGDNFAESNLRSTQSGGFDLKAMMDPSAWRKALERKSWTSSLDIEDWSSLAKNPEAKVKAALWAMKIGSSKQDLFFELVGKLRETMKHAEEMLGKELKLSLVDCYAPVMFLMNAWEEFTAGSPNAVRDIALQDGAKPVSKATLREVDRYLEFANAAYDALDGESLVEFLARQHFTLVYHEKSTDYEMAAHYVAFNPKDKIAVISIKGTSTIGDVLTDILCRTRPFLGKSFAHEGMMNAARRIVARVHSFVDSLFAPTGYKIVVTGHSLGAGVSTLVSVILKEELKYPSVRGFAYASPPVLDMEAALNCKDYIISVVNDRDVICRTSLSNMNIQHEVLFQTNEMLKEGKLSKDKIVTLGAGVGVVGEAVTSKETDSEQANILGMLRTIQDQFKLAYEQDLYIAGRVIYLFRTAGERFDVLEGDGRLTGLRQMLLCKTMISDHSMELYKKAMSDVLFHKHYCHSVTSPAIIRGTPGTHMSIDGWSRFRSPTEHKQVTFYEISTVIVRESDALALPGTSATVEPSTGTELEGFFGFVNHVISRFTAWRRYNDFVSLDQEIRRSGVDTPALPSKFVKRSPEDRAPLLIEYLQSVSLRVVKKNLTGAMQLVLDFVGAGRTAPAPQWVLKEIMLRTTGGVATVEAGSDKQRAIEDRIASSASATSQGEIDVTAVFENKGTEKERIDEGGAKE